MKKAILMAAAAVFCMTGSAFAQSTMSTTANPKEMSAEASPESASTGGCPVPDVGDEIACSAYVQKQAIEMADKLKDSSVTKYEEVRAEVEPFILAYKVWFDEVAADGKLAKGEPLRNLMEETDKSVRRLKGRLDDLWDDAAKTRFPKK